MQKLSHTKTKIVATLGPSSRDEKVITAMIKNGLSVARINMSHGDHKEHNAAILSARSAAKKAGQPVAILQDLAGPKIRIGDISTETITLVKGRPFILTTEKCIGTVEKVHVNYQKLPKEVKVGMSIFLNDGKQELLVEKIKGSEIHTKVITGGTIRGRRGVNVPDANLSISSLTPKDKKDLIFGLEQKVDFVTLSFVRTASDIRQLRKLINGKPVWIVAKIETKSAIDNLEEIIAEADVIMVARGDLAIEMPLETVPLLQKKIISLANKAGKPVITATQMLDSMRTSSTPTRAEVNDIANAILDGSDAIMLSDETTIGEHPAHVVATMAKIACEVESDPYFTAKQDTWNYTATNVAEGVSRSIARNIVVADAKAIVAFSESGTTGRMVARYRPQVPTYVLTPNQTTFNKMLLVFGCEPILIKNVDGLATARKYAREIIKKGGVLNSGDAYIIAAGIPFGSAGTTNLMLVEHL
jgi:pyruvate kinase